MISALDRKLARDLWQLRGQVLSIALVVASGIAVLVMAVSTLEALRDTTEAYYERYHFAEVFATATRVPERVAGRLAGIQGIQAVQTRISRRATLDVPGFVEPVIGRLTSIPEDGQPALNQLALRTGRWVSPGHVDEAILNEPFAEEHNLGPGDELSAIIDGRRRTLKVVGVALSPEFVYALAPGSLVPDDRRFGVVWMGREALGAAFDLENAFNDLSVSLLRGATPEPVIKAIDRLLEPYGGVSAISRKDHLSHWFVMNEIEQIRTISAMLPALFLAVAAFLSYMVLSRLVSTERAQIGLLKALGYTELEVALHYTKFVLAIALVGSLIGGVLGALFGRYNTELYADMFRFPLLVYRPSAAAFGLALSVSVASTLGGAVGGVRRVVALSAAEAMRPPAPAAYRRNRLDRSWLGRWLDQSTRIVLRQIARWPVRSGLTSTGVGLSVGLLIMALQWKDSIDYLAEAHFYRAQHQTLSIGLVEPQARSVVQEVEHLPGVMMAEPWRLVPADFSVGNRRHRGALIGRPANAKLQPVHDEATRDDLPVPRAGVALGTYLADKLGVDIGDAVWVDALEERRPSRWLPVAALFESTIGMPAVMDLDALDRWLRVRPSAEYLDLLVDPARKAELFAELKDLPEVSAVMLRQAAVDSFHGTVGSQLLTFISIFTGFGCALAFGVAYNSMRIALSERGRELATLRVLGFRRAEISYILIGELALLVLLALPAGCLFGRELTRVITRAFGSELYRVPFVLEASTYGLGVVIAILAATASAAVVSRRLVRLDLIRVLKTRE